MYTTRECKDECVASFKKAIEEVLVFEGGYVHDPGDPGGETKYGISARSYPDLDISALTLDDAIEIYYKDFWVGGKVYMVEDQGIANKLLSMEVNAGQGKGTRLLQMALRSVHVEVDNDGVMGPQTASAVNSSDPKQLLAAYRSECGNFYRRLVRRKPHMVKYGTGWLNRAYA